ncbi:AAA family ATPase, partial [Deinococcus detaillensis]
VHRGNRPSAGSGSRRRLDVLALLTFYKPLIRYDQIKLSGPSVLRNIISYAFENLAEKQTAFSHLRESVERINQEFRDDGGLLKDTKSSFDSQLSEWGIEVKFSAKHIDESDIIKLMIDFGFADKNSPDKEISIENYGHGFQRSVIFNLIKLASESKSKQNAGHSSSTTLIFEEPEAYLHPNQQTVLFRHLKKLSETEDSQVIVTSHSPNFVQKSSQNLKSIARVSRDQGISKVFQLDDAKLEDLLAQQSKINEVLSGLTVDQENYTDNFSYHIWLDSERSSLFFAGKVLIVEGATERVLLNYLFENDWSDFDNQKLYILDSLGKYNISRYMKLLEAFGIPHGVIYDGDEHLTGRNSIVINPKLKSLIDSSCNDLTIHLPISLFHCLEHYLGIEEPRENGKKPLNILMALQNAKIDAGKLADFRRIVEQALSSTYLISGL